MPRALISSILESVIKRIFILEVFAPDGAVDDVDVGLDDFDDDGAHFFAGVDVDGGAVVGRGMEADGGVDGLEEAFLVDAGEDEARFVEAFGALGAGADAHGGEGVAHRSEEARLFGQRAAVGDHGGGVHLKAVVVVEAEGFVADHARVELETTGF